MAQWLKQRYLKSPPHLQHHCCLIVYGFLQSLIFGYLWNDFQSSWKKIQKPSKFKHWVGLPSNSNLLCIKLFQVGFRSSADCEIIPSSHPREDSQRFYLFKILRAHILPLTNCAFNKPGAQKDHQVPGPEKKPTLGVIKRGLLDNPRTIWRFRAGKTIRKFKNFHCYVWLPEGIADIVGWSQCLVVDAYTWTTQPMVCVLDRSPTFYLQLPICWPFGWASGAKPNAINLPFGVWLIVLYTRTNGDDLRTVRLWRWDSEGGSTCRKSIENQHRHNIICWCFLFSQWEIHVFFVVGWVDLQQLQEKKAATRHTFSSSSRWWWFLPRWNMRKHQVTISHHTYWQIQGF